MKYNLVVAGGGLSGVAAAVSAAIDHVKAAFFSPDATPLVIHILPLIVKKRLTAKFRGIFFFQKQCGIC